LPPAFLSSIRDGVKKLVSLLLNSKDNELIQHYDEALAVWDVENENEKRTNPQFHKNWHNIKSNE
jgi:hypothetical protein